MTTIETGIPGLVLLEPTVFTDERGSFFEAFNATAFAALGAPTDVVQINQNRSKKGVLRGLHFQAPPHGQSKLVRCIRGALYDVAVDIRRGSPTYGKWFGAELTEENRRTLAIPSGFAHGFCALTDGCEMLYVVGHAGYAKEAEGGLRFDDPALGIAWPVPAGEAPLVNVRDRAWPTLDALESPFVFS